MRVRLIIMMLLIAGVGIAQTKEFIPKSKFSLGLSITPQHYFGGGYISSPIGRVGDGILSTDINTLLTYRLNKRFALVSGATFSLKQRRDFYYNIWYNPCGPNAVDSRIQIPLALRFQFFEGKRIGMYTQLGILNGVLLGEFPRNNECFHATVAYPSYGHTRFSLASQLNIGLNYKLTNRVGLNLAGIYSYEFLGQNTFAFQSIGLDLGMSIKF